MRRIAEMSMKGVALIAAASTLAIASGASATKTAPHTDIIDYEITGSDWAILNYYDPVPPPPESATLDFQLDIAPFASSHLTSDGLVVTNYTGPFSLPLDDFVFNYAYTRNPYNSIDNLVIGPPNLFDGAMGNFFGVGIAVSLAPRNYLQAGIAFVWEGFSDTGIYNSTFYGADTIKVSSQLVQTAVPEPATWTLMLLGFGLVGSLIRRRAWAH
jgi:hypothetical protein